MRVAVFGRESFPLFFTWRIKSWQADLQPSPSDGAICQAYIGAVHINEDGEWQDRRNTAHEEYFVADQLIGPRYLDRLRKLCRLPSLAKELILVSRQPARGSVELPTADPRD